MTPTVTIRYAGPGNHEAIRAAVLSRLPEGAQLTNVRLITEIGTGYVYAQGTYTTKKDREGIMR